MPMGDPGQDLEHLRAEIEFRAKLARQHVDGEMLLPDYYGKEEHDRILRQRVDETRRTMARLARHGVGLSPFLELGAERGQRSLVLANDFGADGAAVDISYHQLRTMEHFAELFGMERLPLRVCADAKSMPFRTNSVPFAFVYQFLHHFPSPKPVVAEIHRVMADGHFYFAEEPFRRVLKLALYRQRNKIYSARSLRRNRYVRLLESFISTEASDETEHGVVENDEIELDTWVDALSVFDDWGANLSSVYEVRSKLRGRVALRNRLNWLLGGLISGLCRKRGASPRGTIAEALACPDCVVVGPHGGPDRPPVTRTSGGYACAACRRTYPEKDGILFLLPEAELTALYPEIARA